MSSPTPADTQRALFTYLHALASFYHYPWRYLLTSGQVDDLSVAWAFVGLLAMAYALWRPYDLRMLVPLLIVQVCDVLWWMPVVPNHWLLTAVIDVGLLAALASTRGAPDTLARLRRPMAWAIALFYAFTGWWKLTVEWFDPTVSCGAMAWSRLMAQVGSQGGVLGASFVIYATLVIELLGPVGLLWRRTRGVVVALFAAFHLVLGLDIVQNFANFSSVMMAALVLLLDAEAVARVPSLADWLSRAGKLWVGWMLVLVALAAVPATADAYELGRWVTWVAHGVVVVAWFARMAAAPVPRAMATVGAGWLCVGLVVLNGLAPVLGIKTRNSWQMYSNLRLEADASNHLVLPRSLDLLGHLSDPVTVEQLSVPALARGWGLPVTLPWYSVHNALHAYPEASITYVRDGQRHVVRRAADVPELVRRSPWWERKVVWYRPLGPEVARTCQW